MRHEHADVIIAWAEGKQIQFDIGTGWQDYDMKENPSWSKFIDYRVKPESKTDVVKDVFVAWKFNELYFYQRHSYKEPNLRLTFDGETGELKSAEAIK
jgi:hypothetical protein